MLQWNWCLTPSEWGLSACRLLFVAWCLLLLLYGPPGRVAIKLALGFAALVYDSHQTATMLLFSTSASRKGCHTLEVILPCAWNAVEADRALRACTNKNNDAWRDYMHGPAALLRVRMEAQPEDLWPQCVKCPACDKHLRRHKEYSFAGVLQKHLKSIDRN